MQNTKFILKYGKDMTHHTPLFVRSNRYVEPVYFRNFHNTKIHMRFKPIFGLRIGEYYVYVRIDNKN